MSATQDKNQKATFVYSNLYHLYKKGKDAAQASDPAAILKTEVPQSSTVSSRNVLKVGDLHQEARASVKVQEFKPTSLIGKRVIRPEMPSSNPAITSLKDNLKALNDLHSRLRFMLTELEDLTKD